MTTNYKFVTGKIVRGRIIGDAVEPIDDPTDPKSATPVYDDVCALVARFEKEDMPYHLRAHRMTDRAYSLAHQLDVLYAEREGAELTQGEHIAMSIETVGKAFQAAQQQNDKLRDAHPSPAPDSRAELADAEIDRIAENSYECEFAPIQLKGFRKFAREVLRSQPAPSAASGLAVVMPSEELPLDLYGAVDTIVQEYGARLIWKRWYRLLRDRSHQAPVGEGWISIESAPEEQDVLITRLGSPMMWVAYRLGIDWYIAGDEDIITAVEPTHWRLLPPSPQTGGK